MSQAEARRPAGLRDPEQEKAAGSSCRGVNYGSFQQGNEGSMRSRVSSQALGGRIPSPSQVSSWARLTPHMAHGEDPYTTDFNMGDSMVI